MIVMSSKKKSQAISRIVIFFVLAVMATTSLVACASQNISATISPTNSQIQIQPSKTSTSLPTTTPRPTITVTAIPTLDEITSLASEFGIPSVCLFSYHVSKARSWIGADCKLFRELIIVEKSSGKKIVIPYQEIDEEASGQFSTRPLSWSSDNKYFYFTTRCCENEDSNGSLYQFDIDKETWGILVHAVHEPFYFFSNNGERYVFLNHYLSDSSGLPEHLEVGMVNALLNTNNRIVFRYIWGPIDDKPIYVWSENSDKFAIILHRLTSIGEHTIESDEVLLKISFTKMDMELVEEFNRNNLLEE
jgi:hypothetical protein